MRSLRLFFRLFPRLLLGGIRSGDFTGDEAFGDISRL
jgi:hypothetical protein